MTSRRPALDALRRPVFLIGVLVALVVVIVWLLVFFLPQGKKLSSLQAQKTSLQQTASLDEAKLQRLRTESHHEPQIRAMYGSLQGYAPPTEQLYTYVQTLSSAARAAGMTITSLSPAPLAPVHGTSYSAIPVATVMKGTYTSLLSMIRHIYSLPRLTDINSMNVSGGGPSSKPGTILTVDMELAIFTSQKPTTPTG